MTDTYRLRVQVTVEKLQDGSYTGERLSVSEESELNVSTFTAVAGVLAQFHDLTEKMNKTWVG